MIRRMKVNINFLSRDESKFVVINFLILSCSQSDILKNLQPKIREKAYIDIQDESLKNEFHTYMQMLKQGRGVMGKFAREHSKTHIEEEIQQHHITPDGEEVSSRAALHHLYKITGKAKIAKVTVMLKRWLADPTLGEVIVTPCKCHK